MIETRNITRAFVESLEPKVKKVDSDEHVDLFCYTTCDSNDSDEVKASRGLVFDKDTLVLKAFSYNQDYTVDNIIEFSNHFGTDMTKYHFFHAYEGALIRVFYLYGKWYVSTHRRLDAFKSKWGSRVSFGEIFVRCLVYETERNPAFRNRIGENFSNDNICQKFLDTLDTDKQYMFLVQNIADNRIVCTAPERPRVFHVGTFVNGVLNLDLFVDIPYPSKLTFPDVNELFSYVEEVDPRELQGVMMFSETEQVKIMSRDYRYLFEIRGNEPSIKYRYLQVRMSPTTKRAMELLYPTHVPQFEFYENTLYEIALHIKNAYMRRFIKKEYVMLPPEEYSVMRKCHSWHIQDRNSNHISLSKVIDVLNEQPASKLNKMIRRFINEQRVKKQQTVEEERSQETIQASESIEQ